MKTNPTELALFTDVRGMMRAGARVSAGAALLWSVSVFCGCSRDSSLLQAETEKAASEAWEGSTIRQSGTEVPGELVPISFSGNELTLWPYTGSDFSGEGIDPINLVFVGKASPAQIRAALMSLDGDRTAFGLPPVPPFNGTWSDANGGVQTAYSDGDEGWIGSVIQLQLGSYGPVRFHLRLFRTGEAFGSNGEWTLGGAHFEVLIPGTADHQVLSWERAEEIVKVDLIRSGLLDATSPHSSTGSINQAPSFRVIPAPIYNGLPEAIKAYIGGPPGLVSNPVPILTNGEATILNVGATVPIAADTFSEALTLTYQQVIPKPFCMDGPFDWVLIQGPVDLQKTVFVDHQGGYNYSSRIEGHLTVTPVDITVSPPAPIGPSFDAVVSDAQDGSLSESAESVMASIKRIAPQDGGTELLMTRLKVATHGLKSFSSNTKCLSSES